MDIELAKGVGVYFRLSEKEMRTIIDEVKSSVTAWKKIAQEIGIVRSEQTLMAGAFRC